MQKSYDGRWTLDQLKRAIEADEKAEFLTVKSIAKGENGTNVATFDNVAADAEATPDLQLRTDGQVPSGTFLFDAVLFVDGNEQRIVGFR